MPSINSDQNAFLLFSQENNAVNCSDIKEPVLNHIMRQINSLKVENLQLKKMIGGKKSSKHVSINHNEMDLKSIKSVGSGKTRSKRAQ